MPTENDAEDSDGTKSVTESVLEGVIEGGLRYHSYRHGRYAFPNDETEQMRDDTKHAMVADMCEGELFFSPLEEVLENGGNVLDLGTGTGKWCMELADKYPGSQFHGMDLSPIQPDWVPENVHFVVDDIEHEAGWTYPENHFDFIHIRHVVHSLRDRKSLWKRIMKHLKPGGYIEIQEFHNIAACDDDSCDGPYAWRDFLRYLTDGMAALGTDLHGILYVHDELVDAGFEDVCRKSLKFPIGPWPRKTQLKESGRTFRDTILWGLLGLSRRPFHDGLNWTDIQIQMFLVDVRKSLTEEVNGFPKFHTYFPFYTIFAQKPLS